MFSNYLAAFLLHFNSSITTFRWNFIINQKIHRTQDRHIGAKIPINGYFYIPFARKRLFKATKLYIRKINNHLIFKIIITIILFSETQELTIMNQVKLIRAKELAELLSVSDTIIWNWVNPNNRRYRPEFPKPIKISPNVTAWRESEIVAYLDQLAANRCTE